MKAIFKGYNNSVANHAFKFTKGKSYPVKFKYYIVDDEGFYYSTIHKNSSYEFEFVSNDFAEEPAHLKYFINGNTVTKGYFYESIGELNQAEKIGVKVSSVNFEIKFE